MGHFLRDRLLSMILIVWATVTLAFGALQVIPGNALINQMLAGGASNAEIAAQQAAAELNRGPLLEYADYILNLLRGNMGRSLINHQPVSGLIASQLGATLELATGALLVAASIGLLLGIINALYMDRWPGRIAGAISLLALSTPIYWTGTLAIYLLSTRLGLLPGTGSGSATHLILPASVLGFHVSGSIARVTRASLQQILEAPFIRTAYAKGLRPRRILGIHVLRAAAPPILSIIALQTGFLLGGTVITEMLFARRGIGQLLQHAVLDQDYPVVLGVVILAAITYSIVNTLADLLHGLLDPRIRQEAA